MTETIELNPSMSAHLPSSAFHWARDDCCRFKLQGFLFSVFSNLVVRKGSALRYVARPQWVN